MYKSYVILLINTEITKKNEIIMQQEKCKIAPEGTQVSCQDWHVMMLYFPVVFLGKSDETEKYCLESIPG